MINRSHQSSSAKWERERETGYCSFTFF